MGWWWSSSEPSESAQQSSQPSSFPTTGPSTTTPPPRTRPPVTRDEIAEAELQAFLSGVKDTSHDSTLLSSSPSSKSEDAASSATPSTPSSINPDSLYQTTMSCRNAFDYAFFCQSFGGQWVNYYRFGELRDCSEHWSDFWFCMRTKSYSEEQRARMIADRNRKKAIKWKTRPSSEDVWEIRTEPVRGAFEGDFAAVEREMKLAEQTEREEQSGVRGTA